MDKEPKTGISLLYEIAATLVTRAQFQDIEELNLPSGFGIRRYRVLKSKIDTHNEFLIRQGMRIKEAIDQLTTQTPKQ